MTHSSPLKYSAMNVRILISVSLAMLVSTTQVVAKETMTSFQRVASVPTKINISAATGIKKPDLSTETSAEIITASEDGNTIVYSDSPLQGVGFMSIKDPKKPTSLGFYKTEGEPTSVSMAKDIVLVGVNTSESFVKPSGHLLALSLRSQQEKLRCELGGQPDSVAVSKDRKYVAIAIENERDEDLNKGAMPQLPAGNLIIIPLQKGVPICDRKKVVSLTGLAEVAPSDPEPEFVDFNEKNDIVVTLQENNHIAIVNAKTGKVTQHFSAGRVDLRHVDLKEEGALTFDGEQLNRKREPDAVKWLDNDRFVTANEGDYEGGSRGFTIFNKTGDVLFESGLSFEYAVARAGHYPEKRSGNKGVEPEGLEVATFNGQRYIFVMSERGSLVGVYKDTGNIPELVQLLPSGVGPESAVAIPQRNLFITANEKDLIEDKGPRAHVMIFELSQGKPNYPQLESVMDGQRPIGWGALSGMVADPEVPGRLYAVNDSFYRNQPTIFTIDATQSPARIIHATRVTRDGLPAQKLDLEGITTDGKGGFWLASEGRADRLVPHALYHVNAKGQIGKKKSEIAFPAALLTHQKRFGAEGVTRIGNVLWIAIQRSWEDDPENTVKLLSYNVKTKEWGAVRYPIEVTEKGWVGLSEITAYGDDVYVIERDNQMGDNASVKRIYRVAQSELMPAKLDGQIPVVKKELVKDLIPELQKLNGFVVDKVEGLAIDSDGKFFIVTDNDGVDDSSGETYFFSLDEEK
ncbi:MAG: esterase-like activity of phytase family protein [Arenicella sp.]